MPVSIPQYLQDHESMADDEFRQLIGGEFVAGAMSADVIDPATGRVFAVSPVPDSTQIDRAVIAAQEAFADWSTLSHEARGGVLSQIADRIEANAELVARLITREQGKPLKDSHGDVEGAVAFTRYFAEWRPEREVLRDDDSALVEIVRKPLGVVAAISAWNFPFSMLIQKLTPALITGNTVILKPAPTTPLSAMVLGRLIGDVVPPGVVNILGDSGEVGSQLTAHPGVSKVSFTGSTAIGRKVMSSAAPTLKHLTLELGGNDAAIVLSDADVKSSARGVFEGAFGNAGQVCISIKRIFVHSSIYDEFCSALTSLAESTAVGPGLDESSEMGPLQNARQFSVVRDALKIAADSGSVIAGGLVPEGSGYFVRPTVVREISEDSSLVTEEMFGPVRPVFAFDTADDAVERANRSPYGLGASVWGSDLAAATEVARRLEAGTTWVNHHGSLSPDVPFGGQKQSGIGCEFGADGLRAFTDIQVINVKRT